jgi:hypothetical protein
MTGMSRATGQAIDRKAHIGQSITDILTTPIGTRVKVRPYGVYLPALVDTPMHKAGAARITAAVADALARWEPRVSLRQVSVTGTPEGKLSVVLSLTDNASGEDVTATTVMAGAV